ncbi:MAG: hypothetical protein WD572_07535 [Gammaproteobacteria bacterium]
MKLIKYALLFAVLLAPITVLAAPGGHHGKMVDKMAEKLDLSAEQKVQVEAVFKEQHAQHQALRAETESKLNAILNAEQQTKMAEMKAERKAKWQAKREEWKSRKAE